MKRKDREVTDRDWQDQVLNEAMVLELGMVDSDGRPYVVPLGFGYEDGAIYLHGAFEGLKNDILAANPYVCFQAFVGAEVIRGDIGSSFSMRYKSVTGFGTVRTLTDLDEKNRALEILMKHYDGPHSPLGESHERVWVARLDIECMTGKSNPGPAKKE